MRRDTYKMQVYRAEWAATWVHYGTTAANGPRLWAADVIAFVHDHGNPRIDVRFSEAMQHDEVRFVGGVARTVVFGTKGSPPRSASTCAVFHETAHIIAPYDSRHDRVFQAAHVGLVCTAGDKDYGLLLERAYRLSARGRQWTDLVPILEPCARKPVFVENQWT